MQGLNKELRDAELLRFQVSMDTTPCCVVNSYCDLENEGSKAPPKCS